MAGGVGVSGITMDTADDGKITVTTIQKHDGNVRYAGDPDNDFAVKVSKSGTITVGKNGKDAVADTGIFTTLKAFEDALKGDKYTTVTGIKQATSLTDTLDSEETGLEQDYLAFTDGTISVTVTDHSFYPPRDFDMEIPVYTAEDSVTSVAAKLNGIPGLQATWNDGYLTIESTDAERYTFALTDTSNFLELSGITEEQTQLQALEKTIDDLEAVMEKLTSHVSDFGARANRIQIQGQIYDNLTLASTEILTEKEDVDLVKILMEMKNKEVAYEAALSAAAKTMQLSLVNFLS
jgi:flagellar hook-associated protein 3 FlgL